MRLCCRHNKGVGTSEGRGGAKQVISILRDQNPALPGSLLAHIPMDRTVVLITGCSSGIGLHLALRLASDPSQSFKGT